MKKIDMVKLVGGLVVSFSVGIVLTNAIKTNTPESIGLVKKIGVGIGGLILHGLICEKAQQYVDRQIDSIVKDISGITNPEEVPNT